MKLSNFRGVAMVYANTKILILWGFWEISILRLWKQKKILQILLHCNILTLDQTVNQEMYLCK